jgi:CTP:molybdopterin cytidylyltransferase MocA
MNGPLAIALLAAGKAERFGGGKLDAELRGKPLGQHALDAAMALDQGPVLLVVGEPVPAFAQGAGELLVNPHATEGLGTSVALAARHAAEHGNQALLLLAADMPLVSETTLRRLVDACAPDVPSAVLHRDGHPGVPACFPRDWFDALQGLTGDKGAGALLRGSDKVRTIAVPATELADVDRPEDLAGLGLT